MTEEVDCWDEWLHGPACRMGAHPTVFHHQHTIGPAHWHCFCGKVQIPADKRHELGKEKDDK